MRASICRALSALPPLLLIPLVAPAAPPDALAAKAGCAACHALEKKVLGPSYHDIAARYRSEPKAATLLAAKVRSGGKGVWGAVPMPPADPKKVSDADLATIVGWILRQ